MKLLLTGILLLLEIVSSNKLIFAQDKNDLDSLNSLLIKTREDSAKVLLMDKIGIAYAKQGNYRRATDYFMKTLQINRKNNDSSRLFNSNTNLGNVFHLIGNRKESLKYHLKAISYVDSTSHPEKIADAYLNLGVTNHRMEYYIKALDYYKKINDSLKLSKCYNNIGTSYYKSSETDQALEYFELSMNFFPLSKKGKHIVSSFNNAGNVYLKKNQIKKAISYLKKSLSLFGEDFQKEAMKSHRLLTICYEKNGQYELALKECVKFAEINNNLQQSKNATRIHELTLRFNNEKLQRSLDLLKFDNEAQKQEHIIQRKKLIITKIIIFGLILITILGGIIGVVRFRKNKDKLILLKSLEYVNDELKRESMRFELKALQASMNPHFISNCMASIQKFIIENDVESSINYLSEFGKLMRMNFEHSNEDFVALDEALQLIETYVSIEKLRIDHHWDFEMNIDERINVKNSTIPPMLIQPIIENAIWHGIKKKRVNGRITFSLKLIDEVTLLCTVEDNGNGRKKNNTNETLHSLDITEKRLSTLWSEYDREYSITFTDIESEGGTPEGTKVEFYIPMDF